MKDTNAVKSARTRKASPRPGTGWPQLDLIEEVEKLGLEITSQLEPKAVLSALVSRLVEHYGVAASAAWTLNGAESFLELGASAGKPSLPPSLTKTPLFESFLGRAVQQGRPQIFAKNQAADSELVLWAQKNRLNFLAAYPLIYDAGAKGVLLVASEKTPATSLLALFRLHAKFVTIALRDADLLASTRETMNKLSILVEATKALGSTLELSELLGRILDVAKMQADAERGTVWVVDYKTDEIWSLVAHGLEKQELRLPIGKGIAGHVAQTGEIVNIPDAYADPRFNPDVDKRTGYRTRNILCLPIRNKLGKIIAVLQLLNRKDGVFTGEDTDFLLTLSGHMALALENAQLHAQILEKERMEKELALARGIQRSLLPETPPRVEGFEIALLNEPCDAVGGDYYDFLSLGPQTVLVVIADVEGKGVASALVMSNLQATLRALVLHLHSLNEIAEGLNRMIWNDTRAQKYLSLFMGLIDIRRKTIHYINCGHVPPLILRPNQAEPIQLTEGGLVIGLFENAPYERGQVKLQTGDVLILCTDGITESMDADHEEYGSERLAQRVAENVLSDASKIVEAVRADVAEYGRSGTHIDDKVMIAIKVKPPEEKR